MTRVFILSCHPLLGQGIESLLCQETELEIVGQETDADRAIERIQELGPDVVLVDNDAPALDLKPIIMRILKERSGITVVGLSLQDNTIRIYHGKHRLIQEVEDLVQAIETQGFSSEKANAEGGSPPP